MTTKCFSIISITALLNFELKICLKSGILLRFIIKRIRPSNTVSIILNLPFEVGKLIWITNNSKLKIHICA